MFFAYATRYFARLAAFCKQRSKKNVGFSSERAAAKYLRQKCGLKILLRNYKYKNLEIDIVAFDKKNDTIVFVEVKSRAAAAVTPGYYAAASAKKKKNIRAAAKRYMASLKNADLSNFRYDVVSVIHDESGKPLEISHFENVGF